MNMEGPAFSTKAESCVYRMWGADVIGMTNMQEARLSREAGICYATIAMVTDYDCWRADAAEADVSVEMILDNLQKNSDTGKKILLNTVINMPEDRDCGCADALKNAIVTRRGAIPEEKLRQLGPILEGFI